MIKRPHPSQRVLAHRIRLIGCASLVLALAACGGGGGDPGTVSGSLAPPPPVPTAPPVPVSVEPVMSVTILDGKGTEISSLSGGQTGVVRAKLVDSTGAPAARANVKFAADANLVVFDPVSASAMTDANGIATINLKPASVSSAGAIKISATGEVMSGVSGGKAATAAINMSVGAAPLTVAEVAFSPAVTSALSAFSTASLSIKVTSAGEPATDVTGVTMNSLCQGDGLATIVPGSLSNGTLSATYTNNGCLRGTDTITVSIGNSSKTVSLPVTGANIGTIQFAGSDLQGSSIVLKGSGGLDRKESALLTYRVLDQNNRGLAGVDVTFRATTTTGGLTVQPAKGTTDSEGRVTTTVSSGTIPTPVRVIAEATRNGANIVGLSDTLIISTGLPIQKALSLSADKVNIEGWDRDGTEADITVRLADQYGNRISDNTAVSFVTEGGAIGSALQGGCVTRDGFCTVKLISQNFRPLNGRVTILAYVQGVENFVDTNGDGQYSCSSFTDSRGLPTPVYRPLIDTCVAGGEPYTDQGDPFLDAGLLGDMNGRSLGTTLDGTYEPNNGDLPIPYNRISYNAAGNGKWGINYIWATTEITFSGENPVLVRQACDADGANCRDWAAGDGKVDEIGGLEGVGCSPQILRFRLHDVNNNPMPYKTKLSIVDVVKITPGSFSRDEVGSTNIVGGTYHSIIIRPDSACAAGSFGLKITLPVSGLSVALPFKTKQ